MKILEKIEILRIDLRKQVLNVQTDNLTRQGDITSLFQWVY